MKTYYIPDDYMDMPDLPLEDESNKTRVSSKPKQKKNYYTPHRDKQYNKTIQPKGIQPVWDEYLGKYYLPTLEGDIYID